MFAPFSRIWIACAVVMAIGASPSRAQNAPDPLAAVDAEISAAEDSLRAGELEIAESRYRSALAAGWSLALRTTQIREEARTLSEQLAETNRQLLAAQSELLRSRTIVTVGEMAAGAAHEMNNPLAVISGRSQLLAKILEDPKQKAAAKLVFSGIPERFPRIRWVLAHLGGAIPYLVERLDRGFEAFSECRANISRT